MPVDMLATPPEKPDQQLVELLRKEGAVSVSRLTEHLGVTATAVRQRLQRLMGEGLIERFAERRTTEQAGRGRPSHQYRLTEKGLRFAGDNYGDLAEALWKRSAASKTPRSAADC